MPSSLNVSLGDIVAALGGQLVGAPECVVTHVAALETAGAGALTFLSTNKYRTLLANTQAACVVIDAQALANFRAQTEPPSALAFIVSEDPYLYFARLTQWIKQSLRRGKSGVDAMPCIHPSAIISNGAKIDPSAHIGALCVIESGAVIGARTVLKSRVTVSENCRIGADCLLHSGVVVGADGFGFAPNRQTGEWVKIEQLGVVIIGNQVEIGANTCIDRGALGNTVIEDGVKLDNLIQIGHNVHIGAHTAMAGCVGVAGSAKIGAHCTIGGGAVVLGHLKLVDHVHISAASVVTRSILQPGNYTGLFPLDGNARWEKNAASLKQLYQLRERIKALETHLVG